MAKALAALIVWLCLALPFAAAQSKPEPKKKPPRPAWSELTPAQQTVLAPLSRDWDELDTTRRKKWVVIADRYPKMKPEEQQRLQKRMQDWAKLSPEERRAAREQYLRLIKSSPPEKRKEVARQWQQYQESLAQPGSSPSDAPAPESPAAADAPESTGEASAAPAAR